MNYPSLDLDRSVFRSAEKKYKIYYDISSKRRKLQKKTDLSDVIDFRGILNSLNQGGNLPLGVVLSHHDDVLQFFCLEGRPGFYFIPGALRIDEQCELIRESLTNFPQPPNRTNHNAIYGPIYGLFNAASKDKLLLEEAEDSSGDCRWGFNEIPMKSLNKNNGKAVQASTLLKKLRWSTLGLQFDWSKRNYDVSLPHNPIPEILCKLVKRIAAPAMNNESLFKPEAAIVNYFGSGDTLGGHLDDMEADWSKPIVSISLGCKAIFLLGGKSRDDPPVAMFLRSGDVVLMAGDARECFHGVPRIFTDGDNADVSPVGDYLSDECDVFFKEYITSSRININVRQVF